MTQYAADSFSDTNWKLVTDHSPTLGGPIVKHPTDGGNWYTVNNRALCRAPGLVYYDTTPASADYTVQATVVLFSSIGSAGVVGRVNTGQSTYYHAYINAGNDELVLVKRVAGTWTNIESKFGMGFSASASGVSYTLALEMDGTALNVYINGGLEIDNTDSAITAAGKGGIRAGIISDTYTGKHIDNFSIFDDTTPTPPARSSVLLTGL